MPAGWGELTGESLSRRSRCAATREGFNYSEAMKLSGIIWDEATLRAFIKKPQSVVKGTAMAFPGYEMPADVDDVIGYLKTLK